MKKIIFSSLLSVFIIFSQVFAIDVPGNLSVDSVDDSSVTLSWDSVQGAAAYSIYYGTTSGELTSYDLADSIPYTLTGLETDTQYFVNITANDENFDESEASEEITFTIGEAIIVQESSLVLEGVELISETKLKLTFNADINSDENIPREFKVSNKFDDLEILSVLGSEIDEQDKNVLILTLQESIPTSAQYNVVAVRLTDIDGNNIQNGIDGVASFITPDSYESLISLPEPEIDLPAAGPTEVQVEISGGSSGKNLSDDELATTTESTAQSAEELPTTGAEHWFLGILALLLGALILKFRISRQ